MQRFAHRTAVTASMLGAVILAGPSCYDPEDETEQPGGTNVPEEAASSCGNAGGGDVRPDGVEQSEQSLWSGGAKWPGGSVPVCFGGNFTAPQQAVIRTAVEGSWESVAKIDFFGWGDCPATVSGHMVQVVVSKLPAHVLGQAYTGRAARGPQKVEFASATPTLHTIIHEFGHTLGFLHENDDTSATCVPRTAGGTSWQYEDDRRLSIMTEPRCGRGTKLSSWDILGARGLYGQKPGGSLAGLGGLCLNIEGGSTDLGARVVGWPCTGAANDTFTARPPSLVSLKSGLSPERCLNVNGGTAGSGFTPLISWECNDAANERFSFHGMEWRAMGNMCVQADSRSDRAKLSLAACNGSDLQKWSFFGASNRIVLADTNLCVSANGSAQGSEPSLGPCVLHLKEGYSQWFTFTNGLIKMGGRCMNVHSGTTTPGNRIVMWDGCGASPPPRNAQFTIRGNVRSMGQCLDMAGGTPVDGVEIGMFPCTGGPNQIWEYYW